MSNDTEDTGFEASSSDHDGSETPDGWDRATGPTAAITEAIAEATGLEPTALSPLYRSVDPDAVDVLLMRGRQRGAHVRVSFAHDGVPVSIGSDGYLSLEADGTTYGPSSPAPESSADLQAALETLLRAAHRNGVSVTGGYGVQNGLEMPDWDVHITRVEKPEDGDR